jgi:hypothetical protein
MSEYKEKLATYQKNVEAACSKIHEGKKNKSFESFKDAINSLNIVVNDILDEFYRSSIELFSKDPCYNNLGLPKLSQNFEKYMLGQKFNKLGYNNNGETKGEGINEQQWGFISQVEAITDKNFKSLKELGGSSFVYIRNKLQHPDVNITFETLDQNIAIFFNLISDVLTELGYKEIYGFEVRERIKFCERFRQIEKDYASVLDIERLEIDEDLLSEFTCDSELIDLVDEICKSNINFLITGEGGIGKTTILNVIYQKITAFNETRKKCFDREKDSVDFLPIPIIVSGSRFKITDKDVGFHAFVNLINKMVGDKFDILTVANELAELYAQLPEKTDRPQIVLLFDGFNEVYGLSDNVCEQILGYYKELSSKYHIQIIATSRTSDIFYADKEKSVFKKIFANGLTEDKIVSYIKSKQKECGVNNVRGELKNQKVFDVLKNPMLLKLYTECQFDQIVNNSQNNEEAKYIDKLFDEKQIVPIDLTKGNIKNICKAYILWNHIQYVLYKNVFRPIFEGKKHNTPSFQASLKMEHNIYSEVLREIIPEIAWELVSQGALEIEKLEDALKQKINCSFGDDFSSVAVQFLTATTGLLKISEKTDNNNLFQFTHQNYRDFFAACHYTKEYNRRSKGQTNKEELHNQLKKEPILPDVKILVGELLGERDEKRSPILKEILEEYSKKGNSGAEDDYAVENIFEIYKALDTLAPIEFIKTDFKRLNFNAVDPTKIISFVEETLGAINLDQLLLEVKPFGKKKDAEILKKITNLFRLSAHCANYLSAEDIRTFYLVWFKWAKGIYRNKTDTPSKSLLSKLSYVALSNDSFATFALTNIGYKSLTSANLGIGENDFLNIFREVKECSSDLQTLMVILDKKAIGVQLDDSIINSMYNLASRNDYTSNFACFLLNYYLYYNLDDGLNLIESLTEKMVKDKDSVKRTMMQFRIISGINFCVQESWCHKNAIPEELKKIYDLKEMLQKIMNNFLDMELEYFCDKTATNYKNFEFNYYFPFGNFFCFDNGIECIVDEYSAEHYATEQNFREKVFEKIFDDSGGIYLDLFQKVILDVACVSTNTFFVQNEIYSNIQGGEETRNGRYLGNTFKFFQELIFKLYPFNSTNNITAVFGVSDNGTIYRLDSFNSTNTQYGSMTEASLVWESLREALAILHYYYPLKTEQFLNKISKCYLDKNDVRKSSDILSLKNGLRQRAEEPFNHLCYAKRKGEKYTIAGFMKNYKNVLAFADLAINVLMSFPIVTETLVIYFEKSFLKNIEDYNKNPKNFIKQTLKELITVLRTSESESSFAVVKEALKNVK